HGRSHSRAKVGTQGELNRAWAVASRAMREAVPTVPPMTSEESSNSTLLFEPGPFQWHSPFMRDASLKFLETLVNTPSPTGHETRGQRVWLDYVSKFADTTFSDAYGNCVAVLNKGGS